MAKSYRRCQECSAVRPVAEFRRAGKSTVIGPGRKVVCPACGYEAPAWAFLPTEAPVESEGAGGALAPEGRKP